MKANSKSHHSQLVTHLRFVQTSGAEQQPSRLISMFFTHQKFKKTILLINLMLLSFETFNFLSP
jgi:hypothetical protein